MSLKYELLYLEPALKISKSAIVCWKTLNSLYMFTDIFRVIFELAAGCFDVMT